MDVTSLLRAVRALAGLDNAALDAVTPDAMRAVMLARGWRHEDDVPWFADADVTAWESWEHDTAMGAGSFHGSARMIPDVQVCVLPGADADEVRRYVAEWAWAVATRHGDVAPAEVLAESLAWASPRARLERLGYRFVAVEGADGAEVDVVAPDGSWRRLDASWPDGERAAAEAAMEEARAVSEGRGSAGE